MPRPSAFFEFALTVVESAAEHEIRYPAAAMAYYAFVTLLPLLVLVLAVLGEPIAAQVQGVTPQFLTPAARRLMYDALTAASGRTGAALFAVAVLAWSGGNVAADFLAVVERVEGTGPRRLTERIRDGVSVLGSLGLAVVSVVLTNAAFSLVASTPDVVATRFVVLWVALAVAFLPMYFVPSRTATATGALPGALTAALGWTVLLAAVQFYAANAARYALYGVLSGVIVILTSFYLAATLLMVGVVVNATLAERREAPVKDG